MSATQAFDVAYEHASNQHTLQGAVTALPLLLEGLRVDSLLDVGCGTGNWLRAAREMGIPDVRGIDGILLQQNRLHVPAAMISACDLRAEWQLGRHFDVALCLEVAEHLPQEFAEGLIQCLTAHADRIIFSAANPWQLGQNHINCQWPSYWQKQLNKADFVCWDRLRWKIWGVEEIEPWYRQNIFWAERNEREAGREPRIPGVVHPDCMLTACRAWRSSQQSLLEALAQGLDRKIRRCLGIKRYE